MYCPQCGKENPDGSAYCAECGAKMKSSETESSEETPAVEETSVPEELPSSAEVPASVPASTAAVAPQEGAKAPSSLASIPKKVWIGVAAGVVALIAVVAIVMSMTGAMTLGQTADTFKTALMQDSIVTKGIASSNYLEESPYTITSYSCGSISVEKEPNTGIDSAVADINVTIENENFTTEAVVKGTYASFKGTDYASVFGDGEYYNFEVVDSTTTPKKGIDFEKYSSTAFTSSSSAGAEPTIGESVLSEDKRSCTVSVSTSGSYWFADSTVDTVYEFTFDGKTWIAPAQTPKPTHNVTYKNINGDYKGKTGKPANFSKFTVRDLDAAKGVFTIDYSYSEKITASGAVATATGTLTATIDPQNTSYQEKMSDGYNYYFEAKGNSSGGNGQASLSGYLTTSDSGEDCIDISKASLDYSAPEGVISFSSSLSFWNIDGPLYK